MGFFEPPARASGPEGHSLPQQHPTIISPLPVLPPNTQKGRREANTMAGWGNGERCSPFLPSKTILPQNLW
jgi:hypothetical protein